MLVEMLVAEMRDREALTEYDQIFAEEIEPMLTALIRLRQASGSINPKWPSGRR